MGDQENTGPEQADALVDAARTLGKVAGKVANVVGGGGGQTIEPLPAYLYQAEYLGSGTFVIRKPKRKKRKRRQSLLKNPQRGSRK